MTLRFQSYNNDIQGINHDLEVFSSVFENHNTCPIFVEQQIDLSVKSCIFSSCNSSRTMNFVNTRTPSTVGFGGKIFKFEFNSIFNCSSTNIGITVSRSDSMQIYDHISCDSCKNSNSGLNPNFGSTQMTEINVSNYNSPLGNGAIFVGNNPILYRVSNSNLINNSLMSTYFMASRENAKLNLTINVNFVQNKCKTALLNMVRYAHLYQNICIFQNSFPTLLIIDDSITTTSHILSSKTDNTTLSNSLEVTDFTTNLISDFTILFSPVPIFISACANQNRLMFLLFITPMIIM